MITKTEDVFAAAETSAFFGVTQQRLGLQQDKVSTFLATIGKMVKELFQLVRELRIIDERLDYYHESLLDDRRKAEAAEITLKGIYIDMVEGGAKNPASVYGMSREVQFTSLPDLFFSTHPKLAQDVDQVVDTDRSDFNKSVRNVLKRKLKTFLVWKKRTFKELVTRRKFTLKYLRQHFDIIKMYMNWVRPYLRHIRRLHFDESKFTSPDLVAAFENSLVDIEFMAHPPLKKINPCIVAHFQFRTRPVMAYQQEGYQRGAQHLGKMQLDLRGYVWSKQEIDNYLELKQAQDFELMKVISASVRAAMEALGDELEQYLKIAGEDEPFTKTVPEGSKLSVKEKLEKPTNLFTSIFTRKGKPKKHVTKLSLKDEKAAGKADKRVKTAIYLLFKDFKKGHQMISW